MRTTLNRLVFVLLLCCSPFAAQESAPVAIIPAHEKCISPEDLRAEFDRLIAKYESLRGDASCCTTKPTEVPDVWVVSLRGRDYRLSADFFSMPPYNDQDEDEDDGIKKDEAARRNAMAAHVEKHRLYVVARLQALKQSLDGFERGEAPARALQANDKATEILSRGEFRRVRMPGIRESWTDQLMAFLQKWLSKIFRNAPDVRIVSRAIVWGAIAIAVIVFGLWMKRFLQREEVAFHVPRPVGRSRRSSKPWEEWLAEAKAAAARGDWREAVHLTYWASVGRLESLGAWRSGEAHTPRELVRLLPSGNDRTSLENITRHFERAWYAQRETKEEDYLAVDKAMEQLCRR